jgi:hypothetical protein
LKGHSAICHEAAQSIVSSLLAFTFHASSNTCKAQFPYQFGSNS